jgi:spore coat polysaccharide biosynthesis protein SpsF
MLNFPGIISQARMTTTRLPGKVLMKVAGKTLLEIHIERLKWSNLPVTIATTNNQSDDPIVELCEKLKIPAFRGDEHDVLSRYLGAASSFGYDLVTRVTSDCPLVDGQLIGKAIRQYQAWADPKIYYSNALERTYPRGFDFEIFSFEALREAFQNSTEVYEREHVTPYIKNKLQGGKHKHFTHSRDLSHLRMTGDEPDDFRLREKLIAELQCHQMTFQEMESVLLQNLSLFEINKHVEQKK